MSDDKHSLILGMTIIVAIVLMYCAGLWKGQAADIAILTGLIGVLGTFTRRNGGSNVEKAETVNVKPE